MNGSRFHSPIRNLLAIFCIAPSVLILLIAEPLAETLRPPGTDLGMGNYTWERRGSTASSWTGQEPPFVVARIQIATHGSYTISMTSSGFRPSINIYQGSFNPHFPAGNFYTVGVSGGSPGTVNQTEVLVEGTYDIVLGGVNTGDSGTFEASISGPGPVTVQPVEPDPRIINQPQSRTIGTGTSTKLKVYGVGALPHCWQWYEGQSGDTTNPLTGATADVYETPILNASTDYWVRISSSNGDLDSATATITVVDDPALPFWGALSEEDQQWSVQRRIEDPEGASNDSYYDNYIVSIQEPGTYTVKLQTPASGFTGILNFYANQFNPGPAESQLPGECIGRQQPHAEYLHESGHL